MKYTIFKLSFLAPVHFGNGRLSKSIYTFAADTLFSAMYKEAIKLFGTKEADKLRLYAREGKLRISDSMPFCNDSLYLPKPIIHITGNRESDSSMKKKFKKLKYIPLCDLSEYLSGDYDPSDSIKEISDNLGKAAVVSKAAVFIGDDAKPYNVGTFTFNTAKGYGLYFICATDSDDALDMVYDIMDSLSFTGIGGKVSSGYGRFDYTYSDAPAELINALDGSHKKHMTLSVSMATDSELEKAVDKAYFELVKRSGFVSSEAYADTYMKKRDFYVFRSGSCFENKFDGDVFDVSDGGSHPVYRYAMPLFYGFD